MAEDIGGVNISVTGDFSDLEAKFSEAISDAQQQADRLASAIQDGVRAPNIDPVTGAFDAISAAAQATGEAVTAAMAVDIPVLNIEPITDPLSEVSADSIEAGKEVAEALDVQISPLDVSPVVESLDSVIEDAQQVGKELIDSTDVALAAPDVSAPIEELNSIEEIAQQASEGMVQDFSDASIPAPDDSEILGEFSDIEASAEESAAKVTEEFADTTIPAPDDSAILEDFIAIEDAAAQSAGEVVDDFDVSLPAPDDSGPLDAFAEVDDAAQSAAQEMADDFDVSLVAPDTSAVMEALDPVWQDLEKIDEEFATTGEAATALAGPMGSAATAIQQTANAALDGQAALAVIVQQLRDGEIGGREFISMANALAKAMEAVGADAPPVASGVTAIGEAAASASTGVDALGNALAGVGDKANDGAAGERQFSEGAQAVIDKQQEANSALAAAQSVLAEVQSAYDNDEASAQALARAAAQVGSAFKEAHPEIKQAADNAQEASTSFGNLATQVLALGGISVSIAALVELGKAAIEAGDHIGDATYAISLFTGSAESAKGIIEGLKGVAEDEGLSFPKLVTAAQRMEALLPPGTDVVETLRNIGNASELMGSSIEATASKFDNLVRATSLSPKTLANVALTMDDVSKAMTNLGATSELLEGGIKKAWAAMDETQHAAVINEALGKLDGVAKQLNDDIGGDSVRAMNQFYTAIAQLGDAIDPVAREALPVLIQAIKGVVTAGDFVVTGLKLVVDAVVGFGTTTIAVSSGIASVLDALSKADFKGAAGSAVAAIGNIQTAVKQMTDEIEGDVKAGSDFMLKTWGTDLPGAAKSSGDAAKGLATDLSGVTLAGKNAADNVQILAKATHDLYDAMSSAIDPTANESAAIAALEANIDKTGTSVTHANALLQENINRLQDVKQAYDAGEASIGDVEIAENNVAKAFAAVNSAVDAHNKALDDLDNKYGIATEAAEALNNAFSDMGGDIIVAGDNLRELGIIVDSIPPKMDPVNKAMIDFGLNSGKIKTAVLDLKTPVDSLIDDLDQLSQKAHESGDWTAVNDAIDAFDKRISNLAKTDLPAAVAEMGKFIQGMMQSGDPLSMIAGQMDKYEGAIQKLAKTDLPDAVAAQSDYINKLEEMHAPISTILDALAKWDQMQIQLAEDSGTSANKFIVNLDLIKQHTIDVHDSFLNLGGNLFTGLMQTWNDAFKSLDTHMVDAITGAKSWHDAWQGFLKDIEREILNEFIGVALKGLRSELDTLLGSLFPSLQSAITGTGGAIGGLAGAATNAAKPIASVGEAATDAFPAITNSGTAATGLATGASTATSSLMGMVGAISSAVGALAGIAGDIMQAHANNLLGEIEINTRSAFNEISNARSDAWSQYGGLFDRLGDIWGTLQSLGAAGTGQSEGFKNMLDSLSSIGQTLIEIRDDISGMYQIEQNGLKTSGSGTADLKGESLQVLNAMLAALTGIWSDENLIVLGIQNLALDIQALSSASGQGAADMQKLFANQASTTAGQIATITKQISDNNAQIALAISSNNQVLADKLTAENTTLQAQLAALQNIQNYGSQAMADAVAARQAALAQLDAAKTTADRIAALHAEQKADLAIVAQATKDGNKAIADGFQKDADAIAQQIKALQAMQSSVDKTAANTSGLKEAITGAIDGHRKATESQTEAVNRGFGSLLDPLNAIAANTGALGGDMERLANGMANLGGNQNESTGRSGPTVPITDTDVNAPTSDSGRSSTPPRRSFDMGGFVDQDMVANVHAGEYVIPPDITGALSRMIQTPSYTIQGPTFNSSTGGGRVVTINAPITFNGVTNARDMARMFTDHLKTVIPGASAYSS